MERLKNFVCRDGFAEVNTNAGRIRGFMENDVYTFLGIPYGKAKRFKKAEPVSPWKGTLTATTYGYICPNMDDNFLPDEIMGMPRLWHSSEDCLNLNIWTTSLDKEAQKPVMVFLHGGGYFSGSAIHLTCYEGKEQALLGDVVSVTVNHRLNVLGFLDLSQYGDDFRESGNVGILDLVEALKWIQENIASFGGNPDNVTIYGHSGGGGKVTTLMQMPCADGLYHKAIIMSGITRMEGPVDGLPMRITREIAQKNARILVNAAGDTDKLQSMPVSELMALVPHTFKDYFFWSPVPGAGDYPGDPGQAGIREETGNIPVMIGNALCEFSGPADSQDKSQVTEGEVVKKLSEKYGLKGPVLYDIYKKTYPNLKPYYALTLIPMPSARMLISFQKNAPIYPALRYTNICSHMKVPITAVQSAGMGWSFLLFSIMQKTRAVSLAENRPGLRRKKSLMHGSILQNMEIPITICCPNGIRLPESTGHVWFLARHLPAGSIMMKNCFQLLTN